MKSEKFVAPRNPVAKFAHKSNSAKVHESKKIKEMRNYWRNVPRSSLDQLI
jgi:hypothetical protein